MAPRQGSPKRAVRRCFVAAAAIAAAATFAPPAHAAPETLWKGDGFCSTASVYKTFNLCSGVNAWDSTACVAPVGTDTPWSIQRTADAVPTGRFEVRKGDQGAKGGGDRCEMIKQTQPITGMQPVKKRAPMPGGEVRVFGFQALYDASLQLPTRLQYQTMAQWHHSTHVRGCPTSSPMVIALTGPTGAKRLEIHAQECVNGVAGGRRILFTTPLTTDVWHDWQFEIKWSTDPSVGYVRIIHDGETLVPEGCAADGRCAMATQYSGSDGKVSRNHFKLGNYRDKTIATPTLVSYRNPWIGLPG